MAKAKKATQTKKVRAANYDPKVTFDGTFEQMIAISLKGADDKVKARKSTKKG